MKIIFLNGPHKGREFLVQAGLQIARDRGEKQDILIDDSQASNPHAEIVKKKGVFYLQDMDSKNGTLVEEEINDFFALKVGLKFQIGHTLFQVKDQPKPLSWSKALREELKNISVQDTPKTIKIIHPPLILKFKSGVQKGSAWHIYYGPRTVGASSLDLPFLEPKAPALAFSLEVENQAVLFKTLYPDQILLNKKHLKQKKLLDKDRISFGSALIEVSYGSLNKNGFEKGEASN